MADLPILCTITSPTGLLTLTAPPYDLEGGSLAEIATTWRKVEVKNAHVEGAWTVTAVRENTVAPLNVWIEDPDPMVRAQAQRALETAFSQLHYTVVYTESGVQQTWSCEVADYVVNTQQAYRHAGIILVKAQVPRHPTIALAAA